MTEKDNNYIDTIFNTYQDLEIIKNKLHELDKKASGKIIVERNKVKADEWKKRVGKSFTFTKRVDNKTE